MNTKPTPKTDELCDVDMDSGIDDVRRCLSITLFSHSKLETQVAELREALETILIHAEGFYTATTTNAKSRDENKETKRRIVAIARTTLERTK